MVKFADIRTSFYGKTGLGFRNKKLFKEFLKNTGISLRGLTLEGLRNEILNLFEEEIKYRRNVSELFNNGFVRNLFVIKFGYEPPRELEEFYREIINSKNIYQINSRKVVVFIKEVGVRQDELGRDHVFYTGRILNRYVSIGNFEIFEEELNKLLFAGYISFGSGKQGVSGDLITSKFDLNVINEQGGGKTAKIKKINSKYFITKNYPTSNNNCLLSNLRAFINEREGYLKYKERVAKIRENLGFEFNTYITLNQIEDVENYFNVGINVYDDKENSLLYETKRTENIYNVLLKDSHYSIIIKQKEIIKKRRMKKEETAKKRAEKKAKKKAKKIEKKEKLLFFDFETVFNQEKANYLEVYSACWYVLDGDSFTYNNLALEETHYKTINNCHNPVEELILFIMTRPKDIDYKLVGFNNSRFDNFFLANEANKLGVLGNVMYVNNSILQMNIGNGCKSFDLCRFLTCSLKKACDNFKTTPKKLDGFSHKEPQEAFESGEGNLGLKEWINDNDKLLEKYNKLDVLSLCDLTLKAKKAVLEMNGVNITDFMTIGQMGFKVWQNGIENLYGEELKAPLTYEDDEFFRSALCAGRTQAYYKKFRAEGKFKMVDVKSLYPFVMTKYNFPIGDYKFTKKYVEGKLGIYKCKIIHQNMKWQNEKELIEFFKKEPKYKKQYAPIVYPKRARKENGEKDQTIPLDWEYRGEQYVNLTSIDIDCIRKHGGQVEVGEGYYWEEKSDEIFKGYMEGFAKEKNYQDSIKGTPEYNNAKREMCKLFSNSLSGKVIQRNHKDMFSAVSSAKQFQSFVKKAQKDTIKLYQHGSLSYMEGKKLEDKIYDERRAKPSYLGVFIYSYARRYMYEEILSKYVCVYEDTDSALLPQAEYERFVRDNSNNIDTGIYGCFEEEVGNATKIITISPKCYCVINRDQPHKSKYKFKGVSKQNHYKIKGEFKKDHNKMSEMEIREEKESDKCLSEEMFDALYEDKTILVFQEQLEKSKGKEYFKGGNEQGFTVRQRFLIKEIKATVERKEKKKRTINRKPKNIDINKLSSLIL